MKALWLVGVFLVISAGGWAMGEKQPPAEFVIDDSRYEEQPELGQVELDKLVDKYNADYNEVYSVIVRDNPNARIDTKRGSKEIPSEGIWDTEGAIASSIILSRSYYLLFIKRFSVFLMGNKEGKIVRSEYKKVIGGGI